MLEIGQDTGEVGSGVTDQDFRAGVSRFFHLGGTALPRASIDKEPCANDSRSPGIWNSDPKAKTGFSQRRLVVLCRAWGLLTNRNWQWPEDGQRPSDESCL